MTFKIQSQVLIQILAKLQIIHLHPPAVVAVEAGKYTHEVPTLVCLQISIGQIDLLVGGRVFNYFVLF